MPDIDRDTSIFSFASATRTIHERPFRVVVLDGAFDDDLLRQVLEEWPGAAHEGWHRFEGSHEFEKYQGTDATMWSPAAWTVLDTLRSPQVCAWVDEELGLGDLTADTWGGAYHETRRGGFLLRHADFNEHPVLGHWRRANVILFLNEGWDPEWGGALELGPPDAGLVVEPTFNRLVCFPATSTTWHGHPTAWHGPRPRRSLAVYYYQPGDRMPADMELHGTRWLDEEPQRVAHSALLAENEALRASLADANRQAHLARAAADAYEHSRSWRITAPLRALGRRSRRH